MDLYQLAKNRYSCRSFSGREVEEEVLERLLEIQRLAPTAHNKQSQRVYVLRGEKAQEIIGKATRCLFGAKLFLVMCYDRDDCWVRKYDGALGGPMDAVIAGSYLELAIAASGLGTCWVGAFDPAKLREAMQLPDNHIPVAIFPVGYPAGDAEPSLSHSDREPLNHTVIRCD
ncbi:MAG TPA: nitroreductase family protein [Bacillota bacterium]|nr:nitroreductase family protein [Bacillota bacterium]